MISLAMFFSTMPNFYFMYLIYKELRRGELIPRHVVVDMLRGTAEVMTENLTEVIRHENERQLIEMKYQLLEIIKEIMDKANRGSSF